MPGGSTQVIPSVSTVFTSSNDAASLENTHSYAGAPDPVDGGSVTSRGNIAPMGRFETLLKSKLTNQLQELESLDPDRRRSGRKPISEDEKMMWTKLTNQLHELQSKRWMKLTNQLHELQSGGRKLISEDRPQDWDERTATTEASSSTNADSASSYSGGGCFLERSADELDLERSVDELDLERSVDELDPERIADELDLERSVDELSTDGNQLRQRAQELLQQGGDQQSVNNTEANDCYHNTRQHARELLQRLGNKETFEGEDEQDLERSSVDELDLAGSVDELDLVKSVDELDIVRSIDELDLGRSADELDLERSVDELEPEGLKWDELTVSVQSFSSGGRFLGKSEDELEPVAHQCGEGLQLEGLTVSVQIKEKIPKKKNSKKTKKIPKKKIDINLELAETLKYDMDNEHTENSKRINKLLDHVGTLVSEPLDRNSLKKHWEYNSTRLSMNCIRFQGNTAKQNKAIKEIEGWKQIQEERIASMQQLNGGKFLSKRASLDPSFRATIQRVVSTASDVTEQIREEAKIELMALEELIAVKTKNKQLKRELVTIKAILEFTPEYNDGKLVYRLTCKNCDHLMNFVGSSETDLKTTMEKHFEQVNKAIKNSQSNGIVKAFKKPNSRKQSDAQNTNHSPVPPPVKSKSKGPDPSEAWSKDFAQHVAQHYKKSKFKTADTLRFCREHIMVEVLCKQYGAELYWEEATDAAPNAATAATSSSSAASLPSAPATTTTASKKDSASITTDEYPPSVQEFVMMGFELSKVLHAYNLIGDNFDDMLSSLLSSTT